jgi:hypothetical protein
MRLLVMGLAVTNQRASLRKSFAAVWVLASKRSLSCVSPHVIGEIIRSSKLASTALNRANVWSFASVNEAMATQVGRKLE